MARRARGTRSSRGRVGTVLVPLDGSKLAEAAINVAERVGTELVLLSVVAPVNPAELVRADDSAAYRTLEMQNAKAQQYLEAVRRRLRCRGSRARVLIRPGDPGREISALRGGRACAVDRQAARAVAGTALRAGSAPGRARGPVRTDPVLLPRSSVRPGHRGRVRTGLPRGLAVARAHHRSRREASGSPVTRTSTAVGVMRGASCPVR